jgi:hypothetical protein
MTLAEILATFPVGSDARLEALAAWRQAQDRLAVHVLDTKPAVTKPPAAKPHHVEPVSHVGGATHEQRREWEDRKAAAGYQREAEAAAAIRARLKRVVDLTQARLGAVADPKARAAKIARLSEIQASLILHKDAKTLAIIGQSFSEIEARLARLSAE